MKNKISFLAVFAVSLALCSFFAYSQDQNLEGTWVGKTEIPDIPEPVGVTLVIEKVDSKYKCTISDSTGLIQDVEAEDLKFNDNELSFRFEFFDGEQSTMILIYLEIKGDSMSGYWEHPEGDSAPIEMERKR